MRSATSACSQAGLPAASTLADSANLRPSLLQKAFSGELVWPQARPPTTVLCSRKANLRANSMTNSATAVIDQALKLKASERAAIAERLLLSLDAPDAEIDATWAHEANARVEAHDRGQIASVAAEDVFAKYKTR